MGQHPAGPRSLGRALAGSRPQERPGCPPTSASGGGSKAEARVLVINTGGTIGMVQDVKGEGGARAERGAAEAGFPPGQGGLRSRPGAGGRLGDAPSRPAEALEAAASLSDSRPLVGALPCAAQGFGSPGFLRTGPSSAGRACAFLSASPPAGRLFGVA